MIFTSFAWGHKYCDAIERLRESAHRYALPVDLHRRDGEPRFRGAALKLKPEVLMYELLVHDTAVWVDADGVFRGPWDFEFRADLAAPQDRGLWGAGVLVFSRTDAALEVLVTWQTLMRAADWDGNEMLVLNEAIDKVHPVVQELPIEMAWVEAWHYNRYGRRKPVVELNVVEEGCCV